MNPTTENATIKRFQVSVHMISSCHLLVADSLTNPPPSTQMFTRYLKVPVTFPDTRGETCYYSFLLTPVTLSSYLSLL